MSAPNIWTPYIVFKIYPMHNWHLAMQSWPHFLSIHLPFISCSTMLFANCIFLHNVSTSSPFTVHGLFEMDMCRRYKSKEKKIKLNHFKYNLLIDFYEHSERGFCWFFLLDLFWINQIKNIKLCYLWLKGNQGWKWSQISKIQKLLKQPFKEPTFLSGCKLCHHKTEIIK